MGQNIKSINGALRGAVAFACLSVTALATTASAPAQPLPDGRGYEMVSPLQKNNAEAGEAQSETLYFSPVPRQAAPSGNAVSYAAYTAFGPGVESSPLASQYLSRRTSTGWSTENLDPLFEEGYLRDPVVGLSADLAHAAVVVRMPSLTPDADQGLTNLYARDNLAGTFSALTTEPPAPKITVPISVYCVGFGGASTDFSSVFFNAKGALIPGDTAGSGFNLYEWRRGQGLRLVSVLPDGTRATPAVSTDFGDGNTSVQAADCTPVDMIRRHAVAADGSRAFWTYQGSYGGAANPLFAWNASSGTTTQIDKPNAGVGGAGGEGTYFDASADGSRVFFTDAKDLTATVSPGIGKDLYLYDFDAPVGQRLSDLSASATEPAAVQGVVGASENGEFVYFVATGALTPPSQENEQGEHAEPATGNLYVWHEGDGLRFIAQLKLSNTAAEPQDQYNWFPLRSQRDVTARVAPSGQHVAFLSVRSLTGYDNTVREDPTCHRNETGFTAEVECAEAFAYDYATDSLSCASCNPDGQRPTAATLVPGWSAPYQGPRFLSDDGSRLFFQTENALLPEDTNGLQDVYQWAAVGSAGCAIGDASYSAVNRGCIGLVSSGTSSGNSELIDASASGSDVFFVTRQRLTWEDEDGHLDVYDARVGGGFAQPPVEAACASAEQCHPGAGAQPAQASAGTSRLSGGGNPRWAEPCAALHRSRILAKQARELRRRAAVLAAHGKAAQAGSLRSKAARLARQARRLQAKCPRNPR